MLVKRIYVSLPGAMKSIYEEKLLKNRLCTFLGIMI